MLGGEITVDAATTEANPVGACRPITPEENALSDKTAWLPVYDGRHTLFLNPPGGDRGKLIRKFWDRWNVESRKFTAAVWVDFNLDHLRFIQVKTEDLLVIPRKRIGFVDPRTGKEKKGAQTGAFLIFRGTKVNAPIVFPDSEYLRIQA